jgi:hypothetical protein
VTKRFADVDLILLVDSAQQPMQTAPIALLRAAGTSGCADKVALAFTHFDQVKGNNLQTLVQKRAHVIASMTTSFAGLRQALAAMGLDMPVRHRKPSPRSTQLWLPSPVVLRVLDSTQTRSAATLCAS